LIGGHVEFQDGMPSQPILLIMLLMDYFVHNNVGFDTKLRDLVSLEPEISKNLYFQWRTFSNSRWPPKY
jgi:hypothetical protein